LLACHAAAAGFSGSGGEVSALGPRWNGGCLAGKTQATLRQRFSPGWIPIQQVAIVSAGRYGIPAVLLFRKFAILA
jgi:hypothetical protein